jgi:hypothetical protein
LEINQTTWLLFALTALLWAASAFLATDRASGDRLTWRSIPLSIFGFVWLAFGIQFIFRFLLLAYDPILFRTTRFPPWMLTAGVLSRAWLALAIFWGLFCLSYAWASNRMWKTSKTAGLQLERFISINNIRIYYAICIVSSIIIIVTNIETIPRAIITPLGLFTSVYLIPLTIAWILYFKGEPIGIHRFMFIIPGIIMYILNPYRQHLVMVVLALTIPAIQLKRNVSFYKVIIGIFISFIIFSIFNDIYRPMRWGPTDKIGQEDVADKWETWKEDPTTSPWVKLANRFHAFDSVAITINAIPSFFPFSKRNVFTESMVRAVIPRAIIDTKPDVSQGRIFSSTIWSLSERGLPMKRSTAMIAPSMVGDLYSANGLPFVLFGGMAFGLVVALLERFLPISGQASGCIVVAYFGVILAWALEGDFANSVATLIQHFVVFTLVVFCLNKMMSDKVLPRKNWLIERESKGKI